MTLLEGTAIGSWLSVVVAAIVLVYRAAWLTRKDRKEMERARRERESK